MTPPPDFQIGKHAVTWTRQPNSDAVQFVAWTHLDAVYIRAERTPDRTNVLMYRDFVADITTESDLDDLIAEWDAMVETADDVRERP